ncbi:MAG TPA: GAF domain-containing protein [Candidatus Binatia bacterium]|jgi:signal transduction histidine kinase|nr:GAF domain-containing protein [Candidatus Binatia bacterium]
MIGAMIDISDRKRVEEQSKRRLESLNLLITAAQKLVEGRDVATLAQSILNTIVTSFGFRLAWIGHANPDGRVRPLYWAGGVADYLKEVEIRWDNSPLGRGPAGRAIATGRPVVMNVATDPGFTPWREPALAYGYREVAAFPLKRGDKPFGNLILFSGETGFFTPERLDLLQTYTHIAAAALENGRLFDETERSLERIRALQEIEQAITSTLDFRTVLDVLLEKIDFLLPYAAATVRLFNEESGLLEPVACRNLDEDEWRTPQWRGGRGLANGVFESRSPTVIRNVLTDRRVQDHEFYRRYRLVSFLGIPLIVKEQILGVISFYTREEHDFDPEEIEFLSTLSQQAAIAIYNSQLYKQSQSQAVELEKANKDLERREEIQKLLKELSQDITTLSLDSLLKKLTEKIREILRVDVSNVRILVEGNWKLVGIAGIEPHLLTSTRSGTSRGHSGWIQEHRRPLVIPDLTRSEIPSGRTLKKLGLRGYIGVPLFSKGGEVMGVLRALTYGARDYTQEEVDLLQQLANGAAIAVENARLLEQTKQQAIELAKANKVKDEFLGFVSHELKTPVNAIIGYTSALQDNMFGEISREQTRILEKVTRCSRDLCDMINSLLEATKIEAGGVSVERHKFDMVDFLEKLRSTYDAPLDKDLILMWDYPTDLPPVSTDSEKLKHILQNLISNAIKYTDRGSVTLSARHLAHMNSIEFKVADTGIGIPEGELTLIFEMFRQANGSETRSSGGVGLGLHIVKKFTELLGGKIDVQSELNKGSIFTVTIPYENRLRAVKGQAVSA